MSFWIFCFSIISRIKSVTPTFTQNLHSQIQYNLSKFVKLKRCINDNTLKFNAHLWHCLNYIDTMYFYKLKNLKEMKLDITFYIHQAYSMMYYSKINTLTFDYWWLK
jgi:hypothetical protein